MFLDSVGSQRFNFLPCPADFYSAFAATLDGALSPMVGPGYVLLSNQFGVSVDDVASAFGSVLLGLGCFMLVKLIHKRESC